MADAKFLRYEGASDSGERRMRRDTVATHASPRTIGELLGRLESFTASDTERELYWWADRFVMGYPLPQWQRPLRWDEAQQIQFIVSLWEDLDVGSYLVNDCMEFEPTPPGAKLRSIPLSEVLLDGQQRLTALQNYVLNQFPVPDAAGNLCYWRDLSKLERRFFANKSFPMTRMTSFDESLLRRVYNLRAFGGVAHNPDERA